MAYHHASFPLKPHVPGSLHCVLFSGFSLLNFYHNDLLSRDYGGISRPHCQILLHFFLSKQFQRPKNHMAVFITSISPLFLVSVSVLLVSCCNKISYQKQLWEERIYFGLQFLRDTTHHDKEVHLHFIRKHRINRKWGQGIQPQSLPLGTYL